MGTNQVLTRRANSHLHRHITMDLIQNRNPSAQRRTLGSGGWRGLDEAQAGRLLGKRDRHVESGTALSSEEL